MVNGCLFPQVWFWPIPTYSLYISSYPSAVRPLTAVLIVCQSLKIPQRQPFLARSFHGGHHVPSQSHIVGKQNLNKYDIHIRIIYIIYIYHTYTYSKYTHQPLQLWNRFPQVLGHRKCQGFFKNTTGFVHFFSTGPVYSSHWVPSFLYKTMGQSSGVCVLVPARCKCMEAHHKCPKVKQKGRNDFVVPSRL